MIIVVGCMFFLLEMASKLNTPSSILDENFDLMDAIKILLIMMGMGLGLAGIFIASAIAVENTASSALRTLIAQFAWTWGLLMAVLLVAFLIYLFWWIPTKAMKLTKLQRKQDEGL